MKANLIRQSTLDEEVGWTKYQNKPGSKSTINRRTIDTITVQFEASIIKNEVYSPAGLLPKLPDVVPQTVHVIAKNVFLGGCEGIPTGRLKRFNLILGHIDQKGKIG